MKKMKKAIKSSWRKLWSSLQVFRFRLHGIQLGRGVQIWGWPYLLNKGTISIGDGCTLRSGRGANQSGLNTQLVFKCHPGGRILIGNQVGMSNCILISRDCIEIGDGTLIGADAKIFDNDFHSIYAEQRILGAEMGIACKAVQIGNRCFLGGGSVILKGSQVGNESVIGACAVLSGKTSEKEIWAGNPARFVKKIEPTIH